MEHGLASNVEHGLANKMEPGPASNVEHGYTNAPIRLQSPPVPQLLPTALAAVTSFVEWLDFKVLLMRDCRLLELLYSLISSEELKTAACECLLVILARKVRVV